MSDVQVPGAVDAPQVTGLVVKFWAVTILHEKAALQDEHDMRLIYGANSPADGAAFLLVRHELAKRGAYDYKVPDGAYAQGEL